MKVPSPISDIYMQHMDMELRIQRPGFLDIPPEQWTIQDVHSFIIWCCEEYGIQQVDLKKFQINGKGLCLLTKDNFCERIPDVGDVIYNKLKNLRGHFGESMDSHPPSVPLNLSKSSDFDLSPRSRDNGSHCSVSSPSTPPAITFNPAISPCSSGSTQSYRNSLTEEDPLHSPLNLSKSPEVFGSTPPLLTPSEDSLNFMQHGPFPHYRNGLLSPTGYNIPLPVCHVKLEPNNHFIDGYGYHVVVPPQLNIRDSSPCMSHLGDAEEPLNLNTRLPSLEYHSTSPRMHSLSPNESTESRMFVSRNGSRDDDFRSPLYVSNYADSVSERGEESPSETPSPSQDKPPTLESSSPNKNGKNGESDSKLLWEFINKLLAEPEEFAHLVRWEDKERRVFRIVNTGSLAALWGQQKNRTTMTYEKLSRSLRYYYKMNIISKEPGRRLTYRFMKPPTDIPKGQRGAKPGVPHRPRGWRQKMKEEQRIRKARQATLTQLQKEGADQETIAAFLAENPIDLPPPCLGHPIGQANAAAPLMQTSSDPSRQPCFPGMPMMSPPLKVETNVVEMKDIKVENATENVENNNVNGGLRVHMAGIPFAKQLSAPSNACAPTNDIDSEEARNFRQQQLQLRLQQAQMLRRRLCAMKKDHCKFNEGKFSPRSDSSSGVSESSSFMIKSEPEGESNKRNSLPTTKKRRLLGYVEKGGYTPPPSFGRSLSSCDIVPSKRMRYSQDDIVVHYADNS